MLSRSLVLILLLTWCAPGVAGDKPDRSLGVSMQFVPISATIQAGQTGRPGRKPGFAVAPSPYLQREAEPPLLRNVEEFFDYLNKQEPFVIASGVWIVTNAPQAYTAPENALLQDIIGECAKRGVILYICRFADLPDGWKRY